MADNNQAERLRQTLDRAERVLDGWERSGEGPNGFTDALKELLSFSYDLHRLYLEHLARRPFKSAAE